MPSNELPAGYIATLQQMFKAAQTWFAQHGTTELSFTLPSEDVMLVGNLDRLIEALAPGERARAFLRFVDAGANREATAFQACIVVRELRLPLAVVPVSHFVRVVQGGEA